MMVTGSAASARRGAMPVNAVIRAAPAAVRPSAAMKSRRSRSLVSASSRRKPAHICSTSLSRVLMRSPGHSFELFELRVAPLVGFAQAFGPPDFIEPIIFRRALGVHDRGGLDAVTQRGALAHDLECLPQRALIPLQA